MSRIDKALKALKKSKNVDLKSSVVQLNATDQIPHISTGSIVLDYLIGGNKMENGKKRCPGIPRGRITEIFGNQGAGKTTVAIHTAIQCQKNGGSVVYLDYEHAFSPTYAHDLGLDIEDETFRLIQPNHWQEGAEIITAMADAGVDLIIVDSVAAMKPKSSMEDNDMSSTGQIGHLARLQSDFIPKILKRISASDTALIYINQLRHRIKTSMYDSGPDEETSGGRALKYYASLRIKLKQTRKEFAKIQNEMTGKDTKQEVSTIVRAKNVKNKISRHQGHTADFVIRYGDGIDNIRSVIDIAEAKDIIERGGAWYTFPGIDGEEVKCQGKEALRDYLSSHPEDFHAIVSQISFSKGADSIGNIDDAIIEVEDTE